MSGTLLGRRAIVTGAASGIGRAIAVALAREGCRVAVADRAAEGRAVADEIARGGGDAIAVRTDVSRESEVRALLDTVHARFGGLDVLVNNAGILIDKPLLETTAEDFDRLMSVNLGGVFLVGREALRIMVAQRSGRVINIASELAYLGRANASIYCASKGGVLSMTRAWAREFAPDILVNAIAPGPIDTPLLGPESMTPAMRATEENIPLRRIGRPEEVAGVAVFLAGPAASFMTGQCISPSGGAVMF